MYIIVHLYTYVYLYKNYIYIYYIKCYIFSLKKKEAVHL